MTRFGRYTEGHYTIKRVDKLPKVGNANWLYAIRGPILDKFFRWDAHDKQYETIFINSQGFIPGDTELVFNSVTNELSLIFNDGTVITTIIDIKGFVTVYTDSTGTEKNKIGDYLNEDNILTDIFETNTNIRLDGNNVIYTREDGTETSLDLTFLIDEAVDTQIVSGTWVENLKTIVLTKNNGDNISITLTGLDNSISNISNVLSGNRIATHDNGDGVIVDINETVTNLQLVGNVLTYTKEDNSTDVVDLTPYLDNTNLSRIISGSYNDITKLLTLTRDDSSSFNINLNSIGGINSIVAGTNVTIDNTDPNNPIINATDTNDNTTNTSVSVTGGTTKTVQINDSAGNNVSTTFTDEGIRSLVAGTNVTIDATDPLNPTINASGGGGGLNSVVGGTDISVDNTDPLNPIVNSTVDLSGYVPYVGAINDVDLGLHTLELGKELESTNFNKSFVYLLDQAASNPIFRLQYQIWNGTGFESGQGTGFGLGALVNNNKRNVSAFGTSALQSNTGISASGFGERALRNNTGSESSGFGYNALEGNTGSSVSGFGYNVMSNNSGLNCSGFGSSTMVNNTGNNSSGFGGSALSSNTGYNVSGFGNASCFGNTGFEVSAFGFSSAGSNTGIRVTCAGSEAFRYNTGANANSIGYRSGFFNRGTSIEAMGYRALEKNSGFGAIGIGFDALRYNSGQTNISIGYNSNEGFIEDTANVKTITAVNNATKELTITAHGFGPNGSYRALKYNTTGGTLGPGIFNGAIHMFYIVDANTVRFDEFNGITGGSGTQTLTPQFIYENSISLGSNVNYTKSNQVILGNQATQEVTTANDYVSTGDGKGLILTTPDGTKQYRVSIDNSGNLITTLI